MVTLDAPSFMPRCPEWVAAYERGPVRGEATASNKSVLKRGADDEPRSRSVIDTLKLANRLSGAGMDRRQAEVLADELNAQLAAATATKGDLDGLEQRMGARMDAVFWRTMAGVALLLGSATSRAYGASSPPTAARDRQQDRLAETGERLTGRVSFSRRPEGGRSGPPPAPPLRGSPPD